MSSAMATAGTLMPPMTPDERLMLKVEDVLWTLYKHFNNNDKIDELLLSDGIVDYVAETLKTAERDEIAKIIATIRANRANLKALLLLPQVKQRSEEWFALRRERLTASDIGQAMNRGKFGNRRELLAKKAFPDLQKPLSMSIPPLRHGIMFEAMTSRCYAQRQNDIKIYEFGLIPHPTMTCFGASPDGITELGVMLEFKTPWRRKITGEIPEQYELQMQGQMAVAGLSVCDYVECAIDDLRDFDNYLKNVATNSMVDHGIIIEIFGGDGDGDGEDRRFLYSPEVLTPQKAIEWCNRESERLRAVAVGTTAPRFNRIPWKLNKFHKKRIYFDEEQWTATLVPAIEKFWQDVLAERQNNTGGANLGAHNTGPAEGGWGGGGAKKSSQEVKYGFIDDSDDD